MTANLDVIKPSILISARDGEPLAKLDPESGYIANIDDIRQAEYPSLATTTYLDHAGTTPYPKSLITEYSQKLLQDVYGNPHSASASSQLSSRHIDDARLATLKFFSADPDHFDVIFVANATAAIKLVADAFRDQEHGFWYGYHVDAHTSLVGVREVARQGHKCFESISSLQHHLSGWESAQNKEDSPVRLIGCTGQSNLTGQRIPLDWCRKLQQSCTRTSSAIYSLLDAAALVSTSPLNLSDPESAPDFTALSFYKIFGFPDLGALIVKKTAGHVFMSRQYFGGGTVDAVDTVSGDWHARKQRTLYGLLEDGTLPFHNILALQIAFDVHARIYGSMDIIKRHTQHLSQLLSDALSRMKHATGRHVAQLYGRANQHDRSENHGPVIAFNLFDAGGKPISAAEVEKLTIVKGFQIRTGNVCNPGGISRFLGISGEALRQNYDAGLRCGSANDIKDGKPTGVLRLSLGAMSNREDVYKFLAFITEFFVETRPVVSEISDVSLNNQPTSEVCNTSFVVESLSVFPIKSCAAFKVPPHIRWEVGPKGLAWDREWCLVHQGTHVALSQKRYPRMALLLPELDLEQRKLKISFKSESYDVRHVEVDLNDPPRSPNCTFNSQSYTSRVSSVCGEDVGLQIYNSPEIESFFTAALDVPCTLARFPVSGTGRRSRIRVPTSAALSYPQPSKSIALSNESPILLVSRSSVNRLNEHIKFNSGIGKAVTADSFRANIIVAENTHCGQSESPYIEDEWSRIVIGTNAGQQFEVLGPCQRCQMVCVNQKSAKRMSEPFSTLAKTRRKDGRVWFGMHLCLDSASEGLQNSQSRTTIQSGDSIIAFSKHP